MAVSGTVIVIGATPVVNGTSGRVLYQNSNSVGQMTTTGSGTVLVLQTAPTLTGPVIVNEAVGSSGLTLTGATQTSSFPVLSATQTWNNAGTTFTAALVNVTNTASATGSLLLDLQVSGSKFSVDKAGAVRLTDGSTSAPTLRIPGSNSGIYFTSATFETDIVSNGNQVMRFESSGGNRSFYDLSAITLSVNADGALRWSNDSSNPQQTKDLILARDAANTLAQRNSTNAQTFNIYSTYTSATNNEYFNVLWSSSVLHLGTNKGSGGGTARVLQIDYGGTTTAALSVPITSGQVTFGGGVVTGGTTTQGANFEEFTEMTAPSAGAVNTCRIYAQDNGAGKTQLMALFNTGAAQQIAIQP